MASKTTVLIKRVEGVDIPQTANKGDAGYDVIAISDPKIVGECYDLNKNINSVWKRIDYIEYETGLYLAPQNFKILFDTNMQNVYDIREIGGVHIDIRPRSSISKYNLMLKNSVGLADQIYRGQYLCRYTYIFQPEDIQITNLSSISDSKFGIKINPDKIYKKGDKIAQLVASLTCEINFQLVDDLDETERGDGGFGSSDVFKAKKRR